MLTLLETSLKALLKTYPRRLRLPVASLWCLTVLTTAAASAEDNPLSVEEIYNFHAVDDGLVTAGQVTDAQVPALKAAGIEMVVNLAIADPERNAREAFLIASEGIAYTQIPVVWGEPTLEDLALFFSIMDASRERKTLVHCFANFRASAFTYLYRTLRLGVPEEEARKDLEAIWSDGAFEEYPQWVEFMETAKAHFRSL